jgi:hypothetical protein
MEAPELVGQNIPKAADINVGYLLGMVGWRTWKILRLGMKQRKDPRRLLRFMSTSKPLAERQKGHRQDGCEGAGEKKKTLKASRMPTSLRVRTPPCTQITSTVKLQLHPLRTENE